MNNKKKAVNKLPSTLENLGMCRDLSRRYARSSKDVAILMTLISHQSEENRGRQIFPAQSTLAAQTKSGLARVKQILCYWREYGIISWTRTRKSNRYVFHHERAAELLALSQDKAQALKAEVVDKFKVSQPASEDDEIANQDELSKNAGTADLEMEIATPEIEMANFEGQIANLGDLRRAIYEEQSLKSDSLEERVKPPETREEKLAVWQEARERQRKMGNESMVRFWDQKIAELGPESFAPVAA